MMMFIGGPRTGHVTLIRCLVLAACVTTMGGCTDSQTEPAGEVQSDEDKNLWANVRLQKNDDGQVEVAEIEQAADLAALVAKLHEHKSLRELVFQECGEIKPSDIEGLVLFKSLSTIEFIRCEIEQDGLQALAKLEALSNLAFAATPLTAEKISALQVCPHLTGITLRSGGFDYAAMAGLADLPQLENLQIDLRGFELDKFTTIGRLSGLQTLRVVDMAVTDADMAALPELPELRQFELDLKDLTDAGVAHLKKFPKLESLNLADCSVTDAGLETLVSLTHLQNLDLNGCRKLTDNAVTQLYLCAALVELQLLDTDISGAAFVELSKLKTLRKVLVASKRVSERQMAEFQKALPECDVIRIKPPPAPG